jgi:hypothetical protein
MSDWLNWRVTAAPTFVLFERRYLDIGLTTTAACRLFG